MQSIVDVSNAESSPIGSLEKDQFRAGIFYFEYAHFELSCPMVSQSVYEDFTLVAKINQGLLRFTHLTGLQYFMIKIQRLVQGY
ncbi:MAG TPA: hypothetical protein VKZ56_11295, partial [Membranihabitans sp.]|nr:hypothetical protein [Membranihabitans sp.]